MDHERNKKRNLKIPKDKCEQKYHTSTSMRCSKNASEKKFIAIWAYLKKQENSQINNLILHLKRLEKKNKAQSL